MITPYGSGFIFVDDCGVPIPRPNKPAANAGIETKIEWMRARAAYNDRVTSMGSAAFAKAFRKAMSK